MSKAILMSLVIAGSFYICISGAFGQGELVTYGTIPYSLYGVHVDVAERQGDSLFILAGSEEYFGCYARSSRFYWRSVFFDGCENEYCLGELLVSRLRQIFVYDESRNQLVYGDGYDTVQVFCPGRPVLDASGNLHVLWSLGSDSTYCYGYSTDTLGSFEVLDTLFSFPGFIKLVSSPDDSLVAAVFDNFTADSIYKYMASAGQPINFQSQSSVSAFEYSSHGAFDVTLDYGGNIYAVFAGDHNYNDYCPNWEWRCHFVWTEHYGYRFLEPSGDDVTEATSLQFVYSGPDTVLLLETKGFPLCLGTFFFMSPDRGQTWYRSSLELERYPDCGGTSPRIFGDNLDFFYSTWSLQYRVYYLPIPRDSIFSQLTAIGSEEGPVPAGISLYNYPNPFNSRTNIVFDLPTTSDIELSVYDITGSQVAVLASGRVEAGSHSITWDGHNKAGHPVSSGIYFYKISINGNHRASKSMLLLK